MVYMLKYHGMFMAFVMPKVQSVSVAIKRVRTSAFSMGTDQSNTTAPHNTTSCRQLLDRDTSSSVNETQLALKSNRNHIYLL